MYFVIFWIVLSLAVIAGIFVSRAILVSKLNGLMHASPTPQVAEPSVTGSSTHVGPAHLLAFFEINATTELKEAARLRESLIKKARGMFKRKVLVDILAAIGFWFFGAMALRMSGGRRDPFVLANTGFIVGMLMIVYSLASYILFRGQFRAHESGFFSPTISVDRVTAFYVNPKYSVYFALGFILFALNLPYVDSKEYVLSSSEKVALVVAAVLAALLYGLLWYWLFNYYRGKENYKLLVLRVFDIDENGKFTFDGILRYWKYFGSFFTVVDPSFFKSDMNIGRRLFWLLLLALIFAAMAYFLPDTDTGSFQLFAFFLLLFAVYFIPPLMYEVRTMERNVISGPEVLEEKLTLLDRWPRRISHTFRDEPVICYDSTWQMAVRRFMGTSQVILMDLRGFTDARKGCRTEVKLLLEKAPLKRLTFLVDTDWSNVRNLLEECWRDTSSGSINVELPRPEVNVYIATKKNSRDIQGIMDTLFNSAIVSARA